MCWEVSLVIVSFMKKAVANLYPARQKQKTICLMGDCSYKNHIILISVIQLSFQALIVLCNIGVRSRDRYLIMNFIFEMVQKTTTSLHSVDFSETKHCIFT